MSAITTTGRAGRRHGWAQAVAAVLSALVAMLGVAALGLWAAGAARLPDGAFARVVVATVVTAVGGSVELSGNAGVFAETRAGLAVVPLSVTLVGVFMVGGAFLHPLRRRAPGDAGELAGWAARIVVLWLLGLAGLALAARQTFAVDVGSGVLGGLTGLFDSAPRLGFAADVPRTVGFGLLWLAGVLVLALLVSPGVPLPGRLPRFQESARPAVLAVVALLLGYVVLGVVTALVTAATRGHAADTFAVLLLGLPNLAWPALTVGLGASWHGRVDGPFGLPMPHVLDEVLRTPDVSMLNLRTLVELDGRAWWLLVAAVVLVPAAALLMVARSPAGVRARRHALCFAVALAVAVLVICLVGRISAHYGLSLLGIGDLGGGLSGELLLRPDVWPAVGLAALWGLVTGFLGGLLARPLHRRGGAGPERRTRGR
ncbi:streptophobe family protein [Streptomyces sp. MMS24-I2-30]|uniref:streptophobe family protein n=1 Tax=Streptomyces sp. MMS24-I2-30 TaxID=3351564 RepID=UPI0038968B12